MRRLTVSPKRPDPDLRSPRLARLRELVSALRHSLPTRLACLLAILGAAGAPLAAQIAKPAGNPLSRLTVRSRELAPAQAITSLESYQRAVPSVAASAVQSGWTAFVGVHSGWQASVDRRTGLVASAAGPGVPWIPGSGNQLKAADLATLAGGSDGTPDLATLEAIARRELKRIEPLLAVNDRQLVLNQGRSGQPAAHLWLVDFDLVRDGLVVEGARVVFRVNNGNLIEFGSENLPSPGAEVPPTTVGREKAQAAVARYIGGWRRNDKLSDAGSLHLLPANVGAGKSVNAFEPGEGRRLVKVWQFVFHRKGVLGTWRARVDATSGKLLELADINDYATGQITGGVFQDSPALPPEVVRAMPFADVTIGGPVNSAGLYSFPGIPVTSTLAGPFVRIIDTCGGVSQPSDGIGSVGFGTSGGTDCVTPSHGGLGNTHASRTQFYHANRIMEVGRGWLPSNAWLNAQLPVNVNLNFTCNAYWNGSSLNFFRSGGGCGNTGEIAAVSLHEFGHGLDQNDGTGSAGGTGESYADVTAALQLHDSCIGPGFFVGSNCGGYGDPCISCSGIRDIDFAQRAANTPATVANFTQVHCPGGGGPCGREVHCESYVSSEAVWDFANRDLPSPGSGAAWTVLDRLWYLSRSSATAAFSCTPGPTFTSDGCNFGSWWKTLRAVDDDDGNLANGTPHGGALFAAFDRHGIACASDPGANVTFAGCTPPATPTMTLAAGDNSIAVTVAGSGVFDVYRNEIGCDAGFTKIAEDFPGGTFHDTGVANGTTYYYQAIAQPSGNEACASPPAACRSATPALSPKIQVPGPIDLGDSCVGSGPTQTLNVCNTGNVDLIVGVITSSNPRFSVTVPSSGFPVTISHDFCFPFQVAFHPAATGPATATLTIPSNDPVTPNATVAVSGNGTEPDIRVTGSTDFGTVSNWAPGEKTVSVCNTGACDLAVSSATVSCPDFTLINNPFPAIVSHDSCVDLVVRFTPVLPGSKSCTLSIASNDPDSPAVVRTLTGRTPPFFSLHAGLAVPHGALHAIATQGSTFHLDFVYPWKPKWAWDVRLGATRFDGRAGNPDTDLSTLSANAKYTFVPGSSVRLFVNGGFGLYHFNPGRFEAGGNLGLGLNVPLGRRFALELTYNYDSAFTASPNRRFSQAQLGLLTSF